jgi:hypothetical protein
VALSKRLTANFSAVLGSNGRPSLKDSAILAELSYPARTEVAGLAPDDAHKADVPGVQARRSTDLMSSRLLAGSREALHSCSMTAR